MAHEAYINSKKEVIPSVTQILSMINKKGLMDWSNWLGFKRIKYKEFLNEKALLGTIVHNKIESDIKGVEYTPYIDEITEREADKRFNRYLQWKSDCEVSPIHSELKVHNERYGGTIDFIGIVRGSFTLLDFKTSKKPQYSHFMQLGGYLNLLEATEPDIYHSIQNCSVVCFTEKSETPMIMVTKPIEDMKKYQLAFEEVYTAFITLQDILQVDWKESLI